MATLAAAVLLPLAGAWVAGRDLARVKDFPPKLEIPTDFPGWSWTAGLLVLGSAAALLAAIVVGFRRRRDSSGGPVITIDGASRPFPWWGWLALIWTALWWWVAWTRPVFLGAVAGFTFFPLWLGFIASFNALAVRAGVHAISHGRDGLVLFAASAVFWWLFEWLNRFAWNWHYLGVEHYGAFGYFAHATVCFSTVLPAVAAAAAWLSSRPRFQALGSGPRCTFLLKRGMAWVLGATGGIGLFFTGVDPVHFYPALWLAPLAIATAVGLATRQTGYWTELAAGDWRRPAAWVVGSLLCGFFWELWNWHSLPKWIYTVPFFDGAHLFEMPLPGYLGYLPFGLECLAVYDLVAALRGRKTIGLINLPAHPRELSKTMKDVS